MRTSNMKRKIKVLVVDDSLLFREKISKGIAQDASIEVVATASDLMKPGTRLLNLSRML